MAKCDDRRPTDNKGAKKVTAATWKVEEIPADMRAVMVVYAGCIEGPRVTYQTIGDDRYVLAAGTAEEIARYSIGETVKVNGKAYQRNIGRKQEDTVGRLKDEMKGTGEFTGKGHKGYTITVQGQLVSADSVLNGYFVEKDAVQNIPVMQDGKQVYKNGPQAKDAKGKPVVDGKGKPVYEQIPVFEQKPVLDAAGKQVRYRGGVEMIVSAIIKPGASLDEL